MSEPDYGLPAATIESIRGIFGKHPSIAKAVLYGSRAKGNYKAGSDIDLTLYGEGLDQRELRVILGELDELMLPYAIDLSIFAQLDHPELRDHIQRVGVVFYRH